MVVYERILPAEGDEKNLLISIFWGIFFSLIPYQRYFFYQTIRFSMVAFNKGYPIAKAILALIFKL